MKIEELSNAFSVREPILRDELRDVLDIEKENTFNQMVSNLVSFGIIKRFENGMYYLPSRNNKFSGLKPSLKSIVHKKYLRNDSGIRTGAHLLYKYKLTSQVSTYYEVLSNHVSESTRSKNEYNHKVIVSHPKFQLNKNNIRYVEFLELIKHRNLSDYDYKATMGRLIALFLQLDLDKTKLKRLSEYYNGKRYARLRQIVNEVIQHATS